MVQFLLMLFFFILRLLILSEQQKNDLYDIVTEKFCASFGSSTEVKDFLKLITFSWDLSLGNDYDWLKKFNIEQLLEIFEYSSRQHIVDGFSSSGTKMKAKRFFDIKNNVLSMIINEDINNINLIVDLLKIVPWVYFNWHQLGGKILKYLNELDFDTAILMYSTLKDKGVVGGQIFRIYNVFDSKFGYLFDDSIEWDESQVNTLTQKTISILEEHEDKYYKWFEFELMDYFLSRISQLKNPKIKKKNLLAITQWYQKRWVTLWKDYIRKEYWFEESRIHKALKEVIFKKNPTEKEFIASLEEAKWLIYIEFRGADRHFFPDLRKLPLNHQSHTDSDSAIDIPTYVLEKMIDYVNSFWDRFKKNYHYLYSFHLSNFEEYSETYLVLKYPKLLKWWKLTETELIEALDIWVDIEWLVRLSPKTFYKDKLSLDVYIKVLKMAWYYEWEKSLAITDPNSYEYSDYLNNYDKYQISSWDNVQINLSATKDKLFYTFLSHYGDRLIQDKKIEPLLKIFQKSELSNKLLDAEINKHFVHLLSFLTGVEYTKKKVILYENNKDINTYSDYEVFDINVADVFEKIKDNPKWIAEIKKFYLTTNSYLSERQRVKYQKLLYKIDKHISPEIFENYETFNEYLTLYISDFSRFRDSIIKDFTNLNQISAEYKRLLDKKLYQNTINKTEQNEIDNSEKTNQIYLVMQNMNKFEKSGLLCFLLTGNKEFLPIKMRKKWYTKKFNYKDLLNDFSLLTKEEKREFLSHFFVDDNGILSKNQFESFQSEKIIIYIKNLISNLESYSKYKIPDLYTDEDEITLRRKNCSHWIQELNKEIKEINNNTTDWYINMNFSLSRLSRFIESKPPILLEYVYFEENVVNSQSIPIRENLAWIIQERGAYVMFINSLLEKITSVYTEPHTKKVVWTVLKTLLDEYSDYKKVDIMLSLMEVMNNSDGWSKQIVAIFEACGAVGVKAWQILSEQADIIKDEKLRNALKELKSDASVLDKGALFEMAEWLQNIQIENIWINLGSASIKQVHIIKDNQNNEYVAKFLRPTLKQDLSEDMKILKILIKNLANIGEDQKDITSNIQKIVEEEADFESEIENQKTIWKDVNGKKINGYTIKIPKIIDATSDVIIEEKAIWEQLDKIENPPADIYETIVSIYFHQLLKTWNFHADLHEGNIFYDKKTKTITLIDNGLIWNSSKDKIDYIKFFQNIQNKKVQNVIDQINTKFLEDWSKLNVEDELNLRKILWDDNIPFTEKFKKISRILYGEDKTVNHNFNIFLKSLASVGPYIEKIWSGATTKYIKKSLSMTDKIKIWLWN